MTFDSTAHLPAQAPSSSRLARRGRVLVGLAAAGLAAPVLGLWSASLPLGLAFAVDLMAHWQWFFVACLLLGVGLLAPSMRWRAAWPLVLAGVPLWTATPARDAAGPGDGPTFTVASANVYVGNDDPSKLLAWLATTSADAVVVMEVSPAFARGLEAQTSHPHKKIIPELNPFGIALLSRHPLENVQVKPLGAGMASITAQVRVEGQAITLVALHTMPPLGPRFYAARDQDIATVLQQAQALGAPTLVAGDFNATAWSSGLRVAQGLGFLRTTSLAPTWHTFFQGVMGIPIDQVLASPPWRRVDSERGPHIGSDHYPVLSRLKLAR